jgi:hypothetical protein
MPVHSENPKKSLGQGDLQEHNLVPLAEQASLRQPTLAAMSSPAQRQPEKAAPRPPLQPGAMTNPELEHQSSPCLGGGALDADAEPLWAL